MNTKRDIYQEITNRIIEGLEKGIVPWKSGLIMGDLPLNLSTKNHYHGINTLLLLLDGYFNKRTSPYYATFKQVEALGGKVKKGAKGTEIVFFSYIIKNIESGRQITTAEFNALTEEARENYEVSSYLKSYYVFNVEQTEGLTIPEMESPSVFNSTIEACEAIIYGYEDIPKIKLAGIQPCYLPVLDRIECPAIDHFVNSEAYYAALFHELIHSTGHRSRLDREGVTNISSRGIEIYSFEELIAEIGASFLCGMTRILPTQIENSISYIDGWLKELKNDKKLIFKASAEAQKAVNYMTSNELVIN